MAENIHSSFRYKSVTALGTNFLLRKNNITIVKALGISCFF